MTYKNPYWYLILKHFEQKGYVHNGLTIPFLIGAKTILEPNKVVMTVSDFLNSVNYSSNELTVMFCGDIKEYVFGLSCNEGNIVYPRIDNIIVTDNSFNSISTSEELIIELDSKYAELIESGSYSKNGGQWGYFEDEEIEHLKEVIPLQ